MASSLLSYGWVPAAGLCAWFMPTSWTSWVSWLLLGTVAWSRPVLLLLDAVAAVAVAIHVSLALPVWVQRREDLTKTMVLTLSLVAVLAAALLLGNAWAVADQLAVALASALVTCAVAVAVWAIVAREHGTLVDAAAILLFVAFHVYCFVVLLPHDPSVNRGASSSATSSNSSHGSSATSSSIDLSAWSALYAAVSGTVTAGLNAIPTSWDDVKLRAIGFFVTPVPSMQLSTLGLAVLTVRLLSTAVFKYIVVDAGAGPQDTVAGLVGQLVWPFLVLSAAEAFEVAPPKFYPAEWIEWALLPSAWHAISAAVMIVLMAIGLWNRDADLDDSVRQSAFTAPPRHSHSD